MNWFTTEGEGGRRDAGIRPGNDSANGNAVMFDAVAGKILTVGGSEAFSRPQFPAHKTAVLITLNGTEVSTREVEGMAQGRVYSYAIVLPDGTILVIGGLLNPKEFSNENPVNKPGALSRVAQSGVPVCDLLLSSLT
jgi:galactose oxidase